MAFHSFITLLNTLHSFLCIFGIYRYYKKKLLQFAEFEFCKHDILRWVSRSDRKTILMSKMQHMWHI